MIISLAFTVSRVFPRYKGNVFELICLSLYFWALLC